MVVVLFCVLGVVVWVIVCGEEVGVVLEDVCVMLSVVGFVIDYVLFVDVEMFVENLGVDWFWCILVVVWMGVIWLIDNIVIE